MRLLSGCGTIVLVLLVSSLCYWLYVMTADRWATAAAMERCQPEKVLQVRQPAVWSEYLAKLPSTTPYGEYLIRQDVIRAEMGISPTKILARKPDYTVSLENARGEIARMSYVSATTAGPTFDAPSIPIFSCSDLLPDIYKRYGSAF